MKKIVLKALFIGVFAVVGVIASDQSASALGNVGYFTNNWTCALNGSMARDCGTTSAHYHNDVVLGRPSVSQAVPNFGTNKFAYRDWVIAESHSGDYNRRRAAEFIIATMTNNKALTGDYRAEFIQRFDNPALRMEYKTMSDAQVNAVGSISYRGENEFGQLDFFWEHSRPGSGGQVYDFFIGGDRVYLLQQNCGNPVGLPNLPGIPDYDPENWHLSAGAKVKPTADPTPFGALPDGRTLEGAIGQSFTWELWLLNDGPTAMTTTGASYIGVREGYSDPNWNNNWALGRFPSVKDQSARNGPGGFLFGSWYSPGPPQRFETYTIRPEDVGNTLCQFMAAYPRASSDHSWIESPRACVYVPYNYSLTPTITVDRTSVESDTTPINVSTTVDHSGTPTHDTQWKIVKLLYNSRDPDPTGSGSGRSNNTPCAHFAGALNCDDNWWNSTPSPIKFTGDTTQSTVTELGGDFNFETRVCYAAAVSRPTHDPADPAWAYSDLRCVLAAKRPKIQFWGADVRAGGRVATSRTATGGADPVMYGSWAEYGLMGSDQVDSSSGGALSSGPAGIPVPGSQLDYNQLTFANTPNFGNFGTIPATVLPPLLTDTTGAVGVGGTRSVADLSAGGGVINRWSTGGLTISGGTVPAGKTVVVRSTGTVIIDGNINYAGGGAVNQLSQMVIIARDIIITHNVTEVNAWLVAQAPGAGGTLSTCEAVSGGWLNFDVNACNQPLRVNGPVVTDRLYLRRTFGSESASLNMPAEVINLRPDTYLWGHHMARSTGSIRTGYLRELPPRF